MCVCACVHVCMCVCVYVCVCVCVRKRERDRYISIQLAVLALDELRCTVEDVCPDLIQLTNMKALTQIMNESLHSLMRAGNSYMPTILE